MARAFLLKTLKTIIQRLKKIFIIMVLAIIILTSFMTLYARAADVSVYAEGIYTDNYLKIDIYADILTRSILGFGVKLTYNPEELSVTKAEKNEDVWYFGNESIKYPYKDPDWSSEGEVDIVGGKLDSNNPLEGVIGKRILMGSIIFDRTSSSLSELSLSFLRTGAYKNFVATDGIVLDDKDDGISFGQVTLSPANEIDINMELGTGWRMISMPVDLDNMILSEVFPEAVVVYGFEKGFGYVRVKGDQELEVGKGYWILLDKVQTYTLRGEPIEMYTSFVENSWYMIGGCSYAAQASVNTGNITVIYRFVPEFGYKRIQESENIEPGQGYWILFENIPEQAELKVEKK